MIDIKHSIEKTRLRTDIPQFKVGDVVKVWIATREGGREKTYPFHGTVIRRRGRGLRETFTVRKESYGVGVERIFPLHSPVIKKIQTLKRGKVKRAKLYYLRSKKR
ncbi:MAG TPA: 50S ribosomal protein L19 [Candidatus Omnitrophica bacterium]|nr:50S ribosomal protein L19 [Candidatus Omnitrophota bacterium]